jgi:hypothetical protein
MVRFLNDVFNEQAIARRKKKFLFHLLSPPNKTDAPRAIFERSISIFCLQSRQAEIIKADGVPTRLMVTLGANYSLASLQQKGFELSPF